MQRKRRRLLGLAGAAALPPLRALWQSSPARAAPIAAPIAAHAGASFPYPEVKRGTPLVFPRDEGAHPAFRSEWWYVTGWVGVSAPGVSAAGVPAVGDSSAATAGPAATIDRRPYGFQVTFFRIRPGVAEDSPSRFAPKQLLFAHAAIADPLLRRLRTAQLAAREGFGLAGARTGATDVWIDRWSLMHEGGIDRAIVDAAEFGLDFELAPTQPVLLQGDAGVSSKGPDPRDASFYYSEPQLAVRGTLRIKDASHRVAGVAWLDHEWSSSYLPSGAVGWDWTGINFDDGAALMAFRIRDRAGASIWAGGSWRDAAGHRTAFGPADVRFAPLRRWTSPRTSINYPVTMRVTAGEITVTLEPLFDDQELDARASVGTVYWEGAVRARAGPRLAGRGYLELTGYGEPVRI